MLGSPLARASEAPGKGMHWGAEARHQTLPRGFRTNVGTVGSLQEVMFGPSHNADGTTNFVGALRRAMAHDRLCRFEELPTLSGYGRFEPLIR